MVNTNSLRKEKDVAENERCVGSFALRGFETSQFTDEGSRNSCWNNHLCFCLFFHFSLIAAVKHQCFIFMMRVVTDILQHPSVVWYGLKLFKTTYSDLIRLHGLYKIYTNVEGKVKNDQTGQTPLYKSPLENHTCEHMMAFQHSLSCALHDHPPFFSLVLPYLILTPFPSLLPSFLFIELNDFQVSRMFLILSKFSFFLFFTKRLYRASSVHAQNHNI